MILSDAIKYLKAAEDLNGFFRKVSREQLIEWLSELDKYRELWNDNLKQVRKAGGD